MEKFAIVMLPKSNASRMLGQLQPPVRKLFLEKMDALASSPFSNSERAGFYAPKGGQVFLMKFVVDGIRFYFQVVFKFADSKDENTLLVSDIIMQQV